jgi:hypothetical protein
MANKYIEAVNGQLKEREGVIASTGVDDAGKIVALDAAGKLDETMLPTGIGAETKILTASEALSAGNFVNIWDDAGTLKVRKADATAPGGKDADGYVLDAVSEDTPATIYTDGINNQLTGLTGGPRMFLSATPGAAAGTAPTGTGVTVQQLGVRLSATELAFDPEPSIILA